MKRTVTNPALRLAILAALSLVVYVVAFLVPYSLSQWWRQPLQNIASMSHHDVRAGVTYILAVCALFVLYLLACRVAHGLERGAASRAVYAVVCTAIVAESVVMMALYPAGAADVFDYIMRGRMLAYHGANPFYQTPSWFRGDPFYPYTAWDYVPSAYGPLWELIAGAAARLSGNGVIANVLLFKSLSVLAYAGCVLLIGLILRREAPERVLYGVVLFAWNPLVIYEVAGNGHNDTLMVFFILLGFYWLVRGRLSLAVLAQTAGALVKFIPALLVPIMIVGALQHLKGWRARIRYLTGTAVGCALMIIGAFAPFWRGGDVLGIERRKELFTTSLPTLIQVTFQPRLGESAADTLAVRVALVLLALWAAWQVYRLWRSHDREAPVRAGLSILLFYLLVSCLWFQAWYVIWPLALAALLPAGTLAYGSLLLSFAAMGKMPIFDYILAPNGVLPPLAWREWRLTLGVLGTPWAYFVYRAIRTRASLRKGSVSRGEVSVTGYRQATCSRPDEDTAGQAAGRGHTATRYWPVPGAFSHRRGPSVQAERRTSRIPIE